MINEYFRTNKQKNFQRKSNGRSEKIPSTISLRPPPSLSSLSPLHHVPTMQNQLQTKHSTFLSVPKSMRKNQKEQVNDAAEWNAIINWSMDFSFFFVLVSFSFWVSFVLTSVVVDDVVVVKEPFVPSAIFVIPFVSISVCEPLWTHLRRRCCIRPNRTDALLLRPSSTASALVNKCPTSISFIIIIFFLVCLVGFSSFQFQSPQPHPSPNYH